MSEEEKKAIEDLKKKYTTEYLDDYEVKFMINYIEKQDKIIDLMAKEILILDIHRANLTYDKARIWETGKGIKEYFRKKVEDE